MSINIACFRVVIGCVMRAIALRLNRKCCDCRLMSVMVRILNFNVGNGKSKVRYLNELRYWDTVPFEVQLCRSNSNYVRVYLFGHAVLLGHYCSGRDKRFKLTAIIE